MKINKSFCGLVAACMALLFATSGSAQDVITYYHTDVSGSPIAATDVNGNVLWRENFAPYGERLRQEISPRTNRMWFTGHHHDDDTGLTYAGARHYDPMIGRFMGVDPVGTDPENQFSFNRYVYGNNNPYRYVDPNGLWSVNLNLIGLAGSFGRDRDSAQFFWVARVGLTGLGIVIDPSKNVPRGENRPIAKECESCAVTSVNWEKGNVRAGIVLGPLSWQPIEYDAGTLVGERRASGGDDYYFIEGEGFKKFELLNLESVLDAKEKKGIGLELEANYEWGGTIPDSSIRKTLGLSPLSSIPGAKKDWSEE